MITTYTRRPRLHNLAKPFAGISAALLLLFAPSAGAYALKPVSVKASVSTAFAGAVSSFAPASGSPGTIVTINGSGFTQADSVAIGGKGAIVVSVSATKIVAMVMPGAVTGKITVITAGVTASSAQNFTVTATPYPNVPQSEKLVDTTTVSVHNQPYNDDAKSLQGLSVAISADGNTAVAGTGENQVDSYPNSGIIFYKRVNGIWAQDGPLVRINYKPIVSVAISADASTAVASADGYTVAYARVNGTWTPITDGLAGSVNVSLSADGNTLVSAGNYWQGGYAHIFTRQGQKWVERDLPGIEHGTYSQAPGNVRLYVPSRAAISADGKTVVVVQQGTPQRTNYIPGVTYVYSRVNDSTWTLNQNFPEFTYVKLSADGNTLLAGLNNGQAENRLYKRSSNAAQFTLATTLNIGGQLAMSADASTIVSPGPVPFVLQGNTYVQQTVTGNTYGNSTIDLSADGTTAFVGTPNDGSTAPNKPKPNVLPLGGVYAFVTGKPVAAPGGYATALKFTNITASSTTLSWTNGTGGKRAAFIHLNSGAYPAPLDFTSYDANASYTAGEQIGSSGWYCVYNGTGTSVNITGLAASSKYYGAVIEYNGDNGNQRYLKSAGQLVYMFTGAPAPVAAPTVAATALKFTNTTSAGTTVSWTKGNGASRAVFMRAGYSGFPGTTNGHTYLANTTYGAGETASPAVWYCIYTGTGTSVNVTGLSAATQYRVAVIEYNGAAGTEAYLTSSGAPANVTTASNVAVMARLGNDNLLLDKNSDDADTKVVANNILSPNGDGRNDTWQISNIQLYPNNTVNVVDGGGNVVFSKNGYANDWAGTYRGTVLNEGTYYYSISLGNGTPALRGFFTVVRDR